MSVKKARDVAMQLQTQLSRIMMRKRNPITLEQTPLQIGLVKASQPSWQELCLGIVALDMTIAGSE